MKIKEIVDMELKNTGGIILLKEGIFFRVYNQSAMRFTIQVKPLKVTAKLVKSAGQTVFYGGFPESILAQVKEVCIQKGYRWQVNGEKRVDIAGVATAGEDYEIWTGHVLKRQPLADAPVKRKKGTPSATPVVEKHYDLVMWFMPKLANFPKDQRYLIADRIGGLLLDIQALLIEAVYTADRADLLREVNTRMDQLRYMTRMAKDMKFISIRQYDHFALKTIEIGRMVGGWRRKAMTRKAREAVFTDAACGMEDKGEVQAEDRAP